MTISFLRKQFVLAVCASGMAHANAGLNLGIVPVGELPLNLQAFVSTDCDKDPMFEDCSAVDAKGSEYVFFEGMLTRVSLNHNAVKGNVKLPAGLKFGDPIGVAAHKAEENFRIDMFRGKNAAGRVSYASDFVLGKKAGKLFSLELIADNRNRLVEIVQRLDLP